jgi:hypothetical protein
MGNYYRGEMAPLDDKVDGGSQPSDKVKPYTVTIQFSGDGEYHTRLTIRGKDFFFRALSVAELKRQVSMCFPNARFTYTLSRSAALANDPREILRGSGQ